MQTFHYICPTIIQSSTIPTPFSSCSSSNLLLQYAQSTFVWRKRIRKEITKHSYQSYQNIKRKYSACHAACSVVCLWRQTSVRPTIRCQPSNPYYANHLTEVWLSCSDVIQGLLPKPYFPIWQCWGIVSSEFDLSILTECKQDSYFTKWWQPKTKRHVTTDASYICLLSRCLL